MVTVTELMLNCPVADGTELAAALEIHFERELEAWGQRRFLYTDKTACCMERDEPVLVEKTLYTLPHFVAFEIESTPGPFSTECKRKATSRKTRKKPCLMLPQFFCPFEKRDLEGYKKESCDMYALVCIFFSPSLELKERIWVGNFWKADRAKGKNNIPLESKGSYSVYYSLSVKK